MSVASRCRSRWRCCSPSPASPPWPHALRSSPTTSRSATTTPSAPCRRANAGLQAAVYQTNLLQPSATQCVHKAASDGALSNGALQADNWCQPQTEDLGDGASYTFQVSAPSTVTTSTGLSVDQRKVVSYRDRERRSPAGRGDHQRGPGRPDLPARLRRRGARLHQHEEQREHLRPPRLERNDHDQEQPRHLRQRHAGARQDRIDRAELHPVPRLQHDPGRGAVRPPAGRHLQGDAERQRAAHEHEGRLRHAAGHVLELQQDHLEQRDEGAHDRQRRRLEPEPATSTCSAASTSRAGTIQIASRSTPLFIYIDSPENCGGTSGMGSVVMDGTFTNLYSPAHAIAIMVAGSPTKATSVDLPTNDATSPIGVYAPNSTVIHEEQRQLHGRGRGEDARREEQRQLHLARQHRRAC